MKKYKPIILGKVMPQTSADITEFMHNKYNSFSRIYDSCKEELPNISDIIPIPSDVVSLSVKIATSNDTALENIKNSLDDNVTINGNILTAGI